MRNAATLPGEFVALILLSLAVLLSACNLSAERSPETTGDKPRTREETATGDKDRLASTGRLRLLRGKDLVQNTNVTLGFERSEYKGNAGATGTVLVTKPTSRT